MKSKTVALIVAGILLLSSNIYSQEALKKGVYSLGGSTSFAFSNSESKWGETKSTLINFAPEFSYFPIDNLSIGLRLAYSYNEFEYSQNGNKELYINRPYSFGPVVRYYFPGGNLIPFIGAGYSYSNTISGKNDAHQFSVSAGLNYFLSKSVALEPFVTYSFGSQLVGDTNTNQFTFGLRVNYFILK